MDNNQELNKNNELENIILSDNSSSLKNKKIILSVATLAVVLIVVVVIMNKISTNDENALPKPILPPKSVIQSVEENDDSLFNPVDIIEEDGDNNLDKIAKKLKEESLLEDDFSDEDIVVIDEPVPTHQEKIINKPRKELKKVVKPTPSKVTHSKATYYIQVGSFSRYEPNRRFLKSITKLGYKYEYKKVLANGKTLNKVLVGPFNSESDARNNLRKIRKNVVSGAFLIKG